VRARTTRRGGGSRRGTTSPYRWTPPKSTRWRARGRRRVYGLRDEWMGAYVGVGGGQRRGHSACAGVEGGERELGLHLVPK
jgi:hypothetical protein